MTLFTGGRIAACRHLLLLPQKQLMSGKRGRGAVAAEAPPGRLNTMFSTISTCKLLTSDLFSDHVPAPFLFYLSARFEVQNLHLHAFLMCPLVPQMADR